jgi:hypothetical protein
MKKYSESDLSQDVSDYLQLRYPKVIYRFDFASGFKMSIGQATKHKKLQGKNGSGFPDLTLYKANKYYHALMIELKITSPYLKDGRTLKKDKHLEKQAKYHQRLRDEGYFVTFATHLKETIEIIDEYMSNT